ncbi:MAG TPA: NYN domain-containing protein [Candidatus Dormibacteraeota bacterium]|nr:NYN domain-containing protein [Candidatus Dormibacteraeota bacterium]
MSERLIVDGYNVIHAWPSLKALMAESLEAARDRLIDRLAVYAHVTGADVTVVFDAHRTTSMANAEETNQGVRVIYTRKGHSADHAIERLAYAAAGDRDPLTVATSDRFQRDLVRGMGGAVISAPELERRVIEAEKDLGRTVERYR